MAFDVSQKTLESLEWPRVASRLQASCRTPQARKLLAASSPANPSEDSRASSEESEEERALRDAQHGGNSVHEFDVFAEGRHEVLDRLAETSEARALLDAGAVVPLGGVAEMEPAFVRASKSGTIPGVQLLDVRTTLVALHETARFFAAHEEQAPKLALLADLLEDHTALAREIDACIHPGGDVRDDATPELKRARREMNGLANDLQRRLARYLQDPQIAPSLSDDFFTVRNDRYVLPVRSDARSGVPGIVHDASRSGTTVFIEPQAVVELNNRLRQAELAAAREVERVLRMLTERVAAAVPGLRADLATAARIDLAVARGHLSVEMQAVAPTVAHDGIFVLNQLRHPLLPPDEAVPNDVRLGEGAHVLVISGPNAGGKTVTMKSLGLAALLARAGMHVPADPGARVALVTRIVANIGDGQDLQESLSTFSAHMSSLAEIVSAGSDETLALLDEVGVGTDPGEGAALAQAILETLADSGTRVVATTHYNRLKEMASVDPRFCNASVEFDPETLAPTYRLHLGVPGVSSATSVAARMGMPEYVLARANALLDREDRRLDQMLSELGASRAALEAEERTAIQLRTESESIRDEYREKLERLNERRDKLFVGMRDELDAAFKEAHLQVAGVIRDLQRHGNARDAAKARERLQELAAGSDEVASGIGVRRPEQRAAAPLDFSRVRIGDIVGIPGGASGALVSLPDRQHRVRVRVGSATLVVAAERVTAATAATQPAAAIQQTRKTERVGGAVDVVVPDGLDSGGTLRCDLRGLRVHEATERVADAIDDALRADRAAIAFVHGVGTGALRRAVREELAASPFVCDFENAAESEGGEGVTLARFSKSA
jgi:DNA mismatch repair protein MutS2